MNYPNQFRNRVVVAVGGLVLDGKGRLLLVKHGEDKRDGFWYGKWICPGGRLEPGEGLAEGVIREIKEETNLDARVSRDPIVFDRIVRDRSMVRLHVVYVNFPVDRITGKLRIGSDAGVGRWFSRRELRGIRGELHEDTSRLLERSGVLGQAVA